MPVRAYARSMRLTARPESQRYKLPGRPDSIVEVINLGSVPAYVVLGDANVTVAPITGPEPIRAMYLPAGGMVEIDVLNRSHLAICTDHGNTADLIVMQGRG